MKAKLVVDQDGKHYGIRWECPGCKERHIVPTGDTYIPGGSSVGAWAFDGSLDRPTLTPSVLIHPSGRLGPDGVVYQTHRCHSIITDGRVGFCGDSTHGLAGQTVELPELEG